MTVKADLDATVELVAKMNAAEVDAIKAIFRNYLLSRLNKHRPRFFRCRRA